MQDRYEWIARYLIKSPNSFVSTNDQSFTKGFTKRFGLKVVTNEANLSRSQQLARDLNVMVEMGLLDRSTIVYADEQVNKGYPRWSYIFKLNDFGVKYAESLQAELEKEVYA